MFSRKLFICTFVAVASITCMPYISASPSSTPVTLTTTLGDVIGVRKSVGAGSTMVESFYGIPFAKPPLGNLRFMPPEAAEPWGPDPLDGTGLPNACWQSIDKAFERFSGVEMWNPNANRSEDCLYLNVWRPASLFDSDSGSGDGETFDSGTHKSIMVWIFGGGFYSGTATLDVYDPSQLVAREDVIVVNIGYRTGPLGFLYLGSDTVSGNSGLLDQVMALQWVKDNAMNLGGSPEDITIFGESAGGASVGFHLLSPLSRDLFTNAIMQSTTPLAEWSVMDTVKAWDRSMQLATAVCSTAAQQTLSVNVDAGAVLDCLQRADPNLLTVMQWGVLDGKWFDVTFGPVVDGFVIPDRPESMLMRGDIKLTNVILGVNKDEGVYFNIYAFNWMYSRQGQMSEKEFQKAMYYISDKNTHFKDELINAYSDDETGSHLDIVDGSSGDAVFKCSVVDFAREYTRVGGRAYVYSFEENFSSNPWPDWMGVPHGYEIEAVFGRPLVPGSNNTEAEKELTLLIMDLWATFSKTGSPNEHESLARWPVYTADDQEFVILSAHGLHDGGRLRVDGRMREEECKIWAKRRESSTSPSVDGLQ